MKSKKGGGKAKSGAGAPHLKDLPVRTRKAAQLKGSASDQSAKDQLKLTQANNTFN